MSKELYEKPEIKSEVLEPGALAQNGSGGEAGGLPIDQDQPFFGLCCP